MANSASAHQEIASGYATESSFITLGSILVDDQVDPSAQVKVPTSMLTRHGLFSGATGTGKTKSLQLFAEQLSDQGIPVAMADMKGDLSGLSAPGAAHDKIDQRAKDTADQWQPQAFPVDFLSLGSDGIGVPLRATITSFGPILLAKVLDLNTTQESTLGLIFHWADSQGLELHDLKDLKAVITHLTSAEGKEDLKGIGGVSSATAGVILRAVSNLEADGGDTFFGLPEFNVADLFRTTSDGRGIISLVELGNQATRPALFSTFLMWVLAELFEDLPEAGDLDKPKLVFVFDEAHLLFEDASKAFTQTIEQTVKLIRSKGVGVFFCTQLPTDIPNEVLSQLGARVQHALRAFTPDDQKALRTTVRTYPTTEHYDLEKALTSLGIGEAIVTVLSDRGAPTPVAWTRLRAPRSLMNTVGDEVIRSHSAASSLMTAYGTAVDPVSAYEKLAAQAAPQQQEQPQQPTAQHVQEGPSFVGQVLQNTAVRSFLRSAASAAGRELTRGLFGNRRR